MATRRRSAPARTRTPAPSEPITPEATALLPSPRDDQMATWAPARIARWPDRVITSFRAD
jgi:hypothetical protein